jgi:curved DNA-binding protein CbpA
MNRDFEDLDGVDPYALLGVAPDADAASIEHAYRLLARQTHPDTGGDEESQKRLNLARQVLLDPVRRIDLDRRLREDDESAEEPAPQNGFDWAYGTDPTPRREPESSVVESELVEDLPSENQFGWTYGAGPMPAPPPQAWQPYPPYPPYPQQAAYQYPAPPGYGYRSRWSGLAITSFVLSFLLWPIALPMAIAALLRVRRRNLRGAGLAWAALGISCSWILLYVVAR